MFFITYSHKLKQELKVKSAPMIQTIIQFGLFQQLYML